MRDRRARCPAGGSVLDVDVRDSREVGRDDHRARHLRRRIHVPIGVDERQRDAVGPGARRRVPDRRHDDERSNSQQTDPTNAHPGPPPSACRRAILAPSSIARSDTTDAVADRPLARGRNAARQLAGLVAPALVALALAASAASASTPKHATVPRIPSEHHDHDRRRRKPDRRSWCPRPGAPELRGAAPAAQRESLDDGADP